MPVKPFTHCSRRFGQDATCRPHHGKKSFAPICPAARHGSSKLSTRLVMQEPPEVHVRHGALVCRETNSHKWGVFNHRLLSTTERTAGTFSPALWTAILPIQSTGRIEISARKPINLTFRDQHEVLSPTPDPTGNPPRGRHDLGSELGNIATLGTLSRRTTSR